MDVGNVVPITPLALYRNLMRVDDHIIIHVINVPNGSDSVLSVLALTMTVLRTTLIYF